MVKKSIKIVIVIFLIGITGFIFGCSNDYLGLFRSNDLNERMAARNSFWFLDGEKANKVPRNWREYNLTNENSYSFIVLADTHIENGKAHRLEELADLISDNHSSGDPKIEFVVILGDITQNGALEDILKFIEVADSFGVPCYPVAGNHDIYFDNWSVWRDYIGSTRYRIDFGTENTTSLFILDSANTFFGKEQLDWLELELDKNQSDRTFVFTHAPLFVPELGPFKLQQITDTRERARIVSILDGKCDIMFMGHSHVRVTNKVGNVQYISIEDFVNEKAYCIVTVPATGEVKVDFNNL